MLSIVTALLPVSLALLITARLGAHVWLYRAGFAALTADEFGRMVSAARWARDPYLVMSGPWLPFHTYFYGSLLKLHWELLHFPRAVTIILGVASIILMYHLATLLFNSRTIGLVSATLLAVNPVHLWLSATPLTEISHIVLVLAALVSFVLYLRHARSRYLYLSAACLLIGNSLRFEAWMISLVFSTSLVSLAAFRSLRQRDRVRMPRTLVLAAAIPWLFPAFWLVASYLSTGDPFSSLGDIRAWKQTWYGGERDYGRYLQTFWRIDPLLTLLFVPSIASTTLRVRSVAIGWFVVVVTIPITIWASLHGGQIEPPGNYLRYLAPFVFMIYPLVAYTIFNLINAVTPSRRGRNILSLVIVGVMAAVQLGSAFRFTNDPAAVGVPVGAQLQARRQAEGTARSALIELAYWDYLAIHVGASDLATILYDRPLDIAERKTISYLLTHPAAMPACLATHNIGYIAVKSPELHAAVARLGGTSAEQVGAYTIYAVPPAFAESAPTACPLTFESGY